MVAGLQVPLIPLVEADGKAGATLFWQRGSICVNDGVIRGSTVRFRVAIESQPAAFKVVNVYMPVEL